MRPILYYMIPILTFVALTSCGPAEFTAVGGDDIAQRAQDAPVLPQPVVGADVNEPAVAAKYDCGDKKIAICHVPEGNPDARHTLCLPPPAIEAHLREHNASGDAGDEDYLGACK